MTPDTSKSAAAPGTVLDPGRRLPIFVAANGYDSAAHLSDQDRRLGKEILASRRPIPAKGAAAPGHAALQSRNPALMYQSHPELMKRELAWGNSLAKLVIGLTTNEINAAMDAAELQTDDPDIRRRFKTAMLMVAKVAQLGRDEWVLRLMATSPSWTLSRNQFCHLNQPQSIVWSAEDRLILEFTEAVVRQTVTDELCARAEALWGRKQLLRYVAWIVRQDSLHMAINVNISDLERRVR